jgi:hypothetical protein
VDTGPLQALGTVGEVTEFSDGDSSLGFVDAPYVDNAGCFDPMIVFFHDENPMVPVSAAIDVACDHDLVS